MDDIIYEAENVSCKINKYHLQLILFLRNERRFQLTINNPELVPYKFTHLSALLDNMGAQQSEAAACSCVRKIKLSAGWLYYGGS